MIKDLSSIHEEPAPKKSPITTFLTQKDPRHTFHSPRVSAVKNTPFVPKHYSNTTKDKISRHNQTESHTNMSISKLNLLPSSFNRTLKSNLNVDLLNIQTLPENPQKNFTNFEASDRDNSEDELPLSSSQIDSFLEVNNNFFRENNQLMQNDHIVSILDKDESNARVYLPRKKLAFKSLKLKHSVEVIGSVDSVIEFKEFGFKVVANNIDKDLVFRETNMKLMNNQSLFEVMDSNVKLKMMNCFVKGSAQITKGTEPATSTKEILENVDIRRSTLDTKKVEVIKGKMSKSNDFLRNFVLNCESEDASSVKERILTAHFDSSIVQGFQEFLHISSSMSMKTVTLFFNNCNISYFKTFLDMRQFKVKALRVIFTNCKLNNIKSLLSVDNSCIKKLEVIASGCEFSNIDNVFTINTTEQTVAHLCFEKNTFFQCKNVFSFIGPFKTLRISSNNISEILGVVLRVGECDSIVFENNTIKNCISTLVTSFINCNAIIKNNTFTHNTGVVLNIESQLDSNASETHVRSEIHITRNQFKANFNDGIAISNLLNDSEVIIRYNMFESDTSVIRIAKLKNCSVAIEANQFRIRGRAILSDQVETEVVIQNNVYHDPLPVQQNLISKISKSVSRAFSKSFSSISQLFKPDVSQ